MPDPHDSFAIFAEVAVALAGFSGIIIAFGGRAVGDFTNLEKRRLFNLFAMSGAVLLSSLVGITVLHLPSLRPDRLWMGASIVWVVFGSLWTFVDLRKVARLEPAERAKVNNAILYPFDTIAVAALLLLAVNAVSWQEAWPVFFAFSVAVVFALQQFVLLVQMGFRET